MKKQKIILQEDLDNYMQLINTKHIIDQYDKDFEDIIHELIQMCMMTDQQIQDALEALKNKDVKLANSVVKKDKIINEIQVKIQESCNVMIIRRQPTASDLRLIFSIFSVIFEIERIADVARKLSHLTSIKYSDAFKTIIKLIEPIGELALNIFNQTTRAFLEMDLKEATRLYPNNEALFDLTHIPESQIIKDIHHHKVNTKDGIDIFNTIRSLTKIDSRCQNICELIIYYHLGENVKYKNKSTIFNLVNQEIEAED